MGHEIGPSYCFHIEVSYWRVNDFKPIDLNKV